MAEECGNNGVTYKALWASLLGVASLVLSAGWIAWQVHGSQPHPGAIRAPEFDRTVEHLNIRFDSTDARLDEVNRRLERIENP